MPKLKMPESHALSQKVTEKIQELRAIDRWIGDKQVREIFQKHFGEDRIIGKGAECIVVSLSDGEKRLVAAFSYRDIEPFIAKKIFYFQRIFQTLFPHNFPRFHAVFSREIDSSNKKRSDNQSGTIREKVETAYYRDFALLNEIRHSLKRLTCKYPFRKVLQFIKQNAIEGKFDPGPVNYVVGNDRGEYYLDIIQFFYPDTFDEEKISSWMKVKGYGEGDQLIVLKSIRRLRTLSRQEKLRRHREYLKGLE